MVSHVEKVSTTRALIASPGVLAAAFRALTGFLLFALIDIFTLLNTVSFKTWRTLALHTILVHTSRERMSISLFMPTTSIVDRASPWPARFTVVVTIPFELHTINSRTLTYFSTKCILASSYVG
jgi:hypothetical protein